MTRTPLFAKTSLAALDADLPFMEQYGLLPEVYLDADGLDGASMAAIAPLVAHREAGRELTFHAPFVDLSPAGLDRRVREVTRQRFAQVRELAGILRPRTVVFHSGYDRWRFGWREELWLEKSRPVWEEVLEWGRRCGARVLLENVFETRPDTLAEMRRRLGGELAFCFDTGHFTLFSEATLPEWLAAMGDGLAELHLHDNAGDRDSHLPIGEGQFDFPALLGRLEGAAALPVIVLEHHTREHTLRSKEVFEKMGFRSPGKR